MVKNANQRKSKRLSCTVPVDSKAGGPFDNTCTLDFSRGGLGFLSSKKIPLNKEITIEIDIEDEGHSVFVVGRVKWVKSLPDSKGYRIGISFENILRGSKTRLHEYFLKRPAQSYGPN